MSDPMTVLGKPIDILVDWTILRILENRKLCELDRLLEEKGGKNLMSEEVLLWKKFGRCGWIKFRIWYQIDSRDKSFETGYIGGNTEQKRSPCFKLTWNESELA